MPSYQPKQGDVVMMNFTPNAGSETRGHRPALVISDKDFNIATGMAAVCPISNQAKGGSFEVSLPRGISVTGVVISSEFRTLDWIARDATFKGQVNKDVLLEVLARVEAILGLNLDPLP